MLWGQKENRESARAEAKSESKLDRVSTYAHLAVSGLLLELYIHSKQTLLLLLDVVDGVGDVAESTSRLRVTVGVSLELGIRLRCAQISAGWICSCEASGRTWPPWLGSLN